MSRKYFKLSLIFPEAIRTRLMNVFLLSHPGFYAYRKQQLLLYFHVFFMFFTFMMYFHLFNVHLWPKKKGVTNAIKTCQEMLEATLY